MFAVIFSSKVILEGHSFVCASHFYHLYLTFMNGSAIVHTGGMSTQKVDTKGSYKKLSAVAHRTVLAIYHSRTFYITRNYIEEMI